MVQTASIRPLKPVTPKDFGESEAELYGQIVRAYGLRDEASLKILEEGLRSLQIARECNEMIRVQGRIIFDGLAAGSGSKDSTRFAMSSATRARPS
jgi:hypothetical protein